MPATKEGGIKAAATNKAKYGDDFYKQIGFKGGSAPKSKPHGFMVMTHEQRVEAGRKGGTISRRGKAAIIHTTEEAYIVKPASKELRYKQLMRIMRKLGIR